MVVELPRQDTLESISNQLIVVGRQTGIGVSPPPVHIYLAGIVLRMNNPAVQKNITPYVAGSVDEIEKRVRETDKDQNLNALYQLMFQLSGDFHFNFNALSLIDPDLNLIQDFYRYASMFSSRMGKSRLSYVFDEMQRHLVSHYSLLANYYIHRSRTNKRGISEEDLFKEVQYLNERLRMETAIEDKDLRGSRAIN